MSRIFGAPRQIGYVVDDLDSAVDRWIKLGVGPFFRFDDVKTKYFRVRGVDMPLNLNIAIAYSGDMQIELIHQTDNTPTPYHDFLKRYGPGMQHLSVFSENYDADLQRFLASGFSLAIEGEVDIGTPEGLRFVYFEPGYEGGAMMEVADANETQQQVTRFLYEASIGWDGSDPIRRL